MKRHKVDQDNLPTEEVLAISRTKDILVGKLSWNNVLKCVDCEDKKSVLLNATHYILKSDLLNLPEE